MSLDVTPWKSCKPQPQKCTWSHYEIESLTPNLHNLFSNLHPLGHMTTIYCKYHWRRVTGVNGRTYNAQTASRMAELETSASVAHCWRQRLKSKENAKKVATPGSFKWFTRVCGRLGVLETRVLLSRRLETRFYKSWSRCWSSNLRVLVLVLVLEPSSLGLGTWDLRPWRLGFRHSWNVKLSACHLCSCGTDI